MDPQPRSPGRTRIALTLVAGLALLLAMGAAGVAALGTLGGPPEFVGTAWDPPETAADFTLTTHSGEPASMRDYRGRAVLLFFGYANCPDVCPLTLARLDRVLDSMEADTSEVAVLLVTVDPARDTPAALAAYVPRFAPWVTALTGSAGALEAVRRSYYAYAEPAEPRSPPAPAGHGDHAPPPEGVDFSHTPQVFGIDREGRIRVLLPMERSETEIARDVRTLLRL